MTALPAAAATRRTTAATLIDLISGHWMAQTVAVAARLRIADRLGDGASDPDELAAALNLHPRSVRRLLNALVGLGILDRDENRYRLTEMGRYLRSDVAGSLHGYAEMLGSEWQWKAWAALEHSVRTGETAFDHVYQMPLFEWFARNDGDQGVFNAAMTSYASAVHLPVLDQYPFSDFNCVADIGSGQGHVLRRILQDHPHVRGIAFDLPQVAEVSRQAFAEAGLADRVEVVGGSFFESVPSGADAYVIGHILHDWDDGRSIELLRKIRDAAEPGARLLILEMVVPEDDSPHYARLMDINMMVCTSGHERTAREYADLVGAAGWSFLGVIDGPIVTSIVEAVAR